MDNLDPLAAQAVDHILARAKSYNKFAGIHNSESPQAIERINKGFHMVTVSSDARMIATGSQAILQEMRRHLK